MSTPDYTLINSYAVAIYSGEKGMGGNLNGVRAQVTLHLQPLPDDPSPLYILDFVEPGFPFPHSSDSLHHVFFPISSFAHVLQLLRDGKKLTLSDHDGFWSIRDGF